MKIRFFNIVWDFDDDEEPNDDLPTEVVLDRDDQGDLLDDDFDPDEQGADLLSDKYGWCVQSFDFEVV